MRLYDLLLTKPGSAEDRLVKGSYSAFAKWLRQAQCFEMSNDVVSACTHVMGSKPTTLYSAMPLLHLPFKYTWVEFRTRDDGYDNKKDTPAKMGCLLRGADDQLQKGTGYWAWVHNEDDLTLCPLALAFDWSKDAVEIYEQIAALNPDMPVFSRLAERYKRKFTPEGVAEALANSHFSSRWGNLLNDPKEFAAVLEMEKRSALVINEACLGLLSTNIYTSTHMSSYVDDLSGELPFMTSFLTMLSSKSILERRTDDFVRLNKARRKNNKTPLKEFVVTRLNLSRVAANRAKAAGITNREAARLTLVRGHLKVRKTGIYWWSPHPRGRGSHVIRSGYKTV